MFNYSYYVRTIIADFFPEHWICAKILNCLEIKFFHFSARKLNIEYTYRADVM